MGSLKTKHITPNIKDIHCLPVKFRIDFKVLNNTYKCLNDNAPTYLQELIKPYFQQHTKKSFESNLLVRPKI